MLTFGVIVGLILLWVAIDLWAWRQRAGLLELESQHPASVAAILLRQTGDYTLVRADDAEGLVVLEKGRPFQDGGLYYYAQIFADRRSGHGRIVAGVIGHAFHSAADLAQARVQFVADNILQLTAESAETALIRAGDLRTVVTVLPAMRQFAGHHAIRPPAIDAPMSSSALRFTMRAELSAVMDAIDALQSAGWQRIERKALERGLVTQRRYCLRDAADPKDAAAEYLVEVRGFPGNWVMVAIDWFPRPQPVRPPRRPAELEALIRVGVERARQGQQLAEFVD